MTFYKTILALLVTIMIAGCSGSTGATGASGQDGADGLDGENLEINITVNQPEPEPSKYFDLNTGVLALNADLDEIGSGLVTIRYSVIDNGGDNNFVFTLHEDRVLEDYVYPDKINNDKTSRVDFINSFYIEANFSENDKVYKFKIIYDMYNEEDVYVRQTLLAGTLTQAPFSLGLTEEEIVELVEVTIQDSIGDINITVEAPECVTCEEPEEEPQV